jgi:hypothetical protein
MRWPTIFRRRPVAPPDERSTAHILSAATRKQLQRQRVIANAEAMRTVPAIRERLGLN